MPIDDQNVLAFRRLKARHPVFHAWEVGERLRNSMFGEGHVVNGLLPRASVNILAGDSGIGKSPLIYQLGLAVAAGMPFLGSPTRQCKVLLVDYENSLADSHRILYQQKRFLKMGKYPIDFLVWCMQLDPTPIALNDKTESVIRDLGADLVILDSLRSFSPVMENDSAAAVAQIKRLREIASSLGTAFLLVHHLRKQHTDGLESLEAGPALDWLTRAAGVRALINQTDVRLAIARREESTSGREQEASADLVLRGHVRTRGEVGPFLLQRVWDDDGEPCGYERVTPNLAMIENPDQQAAYEDLGETFSFKDARLRLDKPNKVTNDFVHKLIRLGLARKVARGNYQKGGYGPVEAA